MNNSNISMDSHAYTDGVDFIIDPILNGSDPNMTGSVKGRTIFDFTEYKVATVIWTYVAPIVLVVGTIGSILSLLVLCRKSLRIQTTMFYLAALAVTDLLGLHVGLLRLWLERSLDIYIRLTSDAACKLHTFFVYIALDASVWTLVAVSIDRCLYINWPHLARKWCTLPRARLTLLFIVFCLVLINMHFFWTYHLEQYNIEQIYSHGGKKCYADEHSQLTVYFIQKVWPWMDFCVYCLFPFLFMLTCNIIIVRQLVRTERKMAFHRRSTLKRSKTANDNGQATRNGTRTGATIDTNNGKNSTSANSADASADKENIEKSFQKRIKNTTGGGFVERVKQKSETKDEDCKQIVTVSIVSVVRSVPEQTIGLTTETFIDTATTSSWDKCNIPYSGKFKTDLERNNMAEKHSLPLPMNTLTNVQNPSCSVSEVIDRAETSTASKQMKDSSSTLSTDSTTVLAESDDFGSFSSQRHLLDDNEKHSHSIKTPILGALMGSHLKKKLSRSETVKETGDSTSEGQPDVLTPSNVLTKFLFESGDEVNMVKSKKGYAIEDTGNPKRGSDKRKPMRNKVFPASSEESMSQTDWNRKSSKKGRQESDSDVSLYENSSSDKDLLVRNLTHRHTKCENKTDSSYVQSLRDIVMSQEPKHDMSDDVFIVDNAVKFVPATKQNGVLGNSAKTHRSSSRTADIKSEGEKNIAQDCNGMNTSASTHSDRNKTAVNDGHTNKVAELNGSRNKVDASIASITNKSTDSTSEENEDASGDNDRQKLANSNSCKNKSTATVIHRNKHTKSLPPQAIQSEAEVIRLPTPSKSLRDKRRGISVNSETQVSVSSRRSTGSVSKTLLAVTIMFWIFNAPIAIFIISHTYLDSGGGAADRARIALAWAVVNILQYLNNAMHLFLYCLTSPKFRQELIEMLKSGISFVKRLKGGCR